MALTPHICHIQLNASRGDLMTSSLQGENPDRMEAALLLLPHFMRLKIFTLTCNLYSLRVRTVIDDGACSQAPAWELTCAEAPASFSRGISIMTRKWPRPKSSPSLFMDGKQHKIKPG
jgi:hypothetical protein